MPLLLPTASVVEFFGVDPKTLGLAGLITLIVLMVMGGFLIPSRTHDKLIQAKNEEIARWRLAYETSEAARLLEAETLEKLVDQGETVQHVVEAIHNVLGTHTPSGIIPLTTPSGGDNG